MTSGLAPGVVFGGDYRVVRPLSAGGMGAVYVVEQISTRKQRALKLMHPQLAADEASRRRFDQEARVGASIPSDHVVEVTAAGVDAASGAPFLVMELLEGEDLEATLRRRGRLMPAEAAQVMEQICHAVGAAHSAGIVHRDLKPGNVFLAAARRTDALFTVKVLDFGIAKLVSEHSADTAAMGSPLWLAPEQTERRTVSPATDVWALGLIAYALLTGRSYWRAATQPDATLMQVMREVLFDPLEPASVRAASQGAYLPTTFDPWFARCVSRDPAARYQNATHLFADLAPVLGYQPRSTAPSPGGAALAPPVAAPQPYVTRYDSGSVASADPGAPLLPPPGSPVGTTSGAALAASRPGRGATGGVLALGCAGTTLIASLVVALVAVIAVVLLRGAPAAPVSETPTASAPDPLASAAPAASGDDSAETVTREASDSPATAARSPGERGTSARGAPTTAPPIGRATSPEPPGATASPATATTGKRQRKAVVTTLLGGSDPSRLPPDGSSVINARVPQFRACYERGIAKDDEDHFGESMILYLHIAADGSLTGVESRIDTAPPGVGTCILPIVRSVRFSSPPEGPVQGNLILNFRTDR